MIVDRKLAECTLHNTVVSTGTGTINNTYYVLLLCINIIIIHDVLVITHTCTYCRLVNIDSGLFQSGCSCASDYSSPALFAHLINAAQLKRLTRLNVIQFY